MSSDDETIDETVYVPQRKKTNLLMVFLLMIAGMFLAIGIASLTTIIVIIRSLIMDFLTVLTGWDPILSSIFVMVIAFFLATIIYLVARRGLEIVQNVENILKLNVTNEPTEYYELGIIETEELIHEFKKRDCKTTINKDKGFTIDCSNIQPTKRIRGAVSQDHYTLDNMQKLGVIATIVVLWGVLVGITIMGVIDDSFIWMVAIALFIFSSILLVGVRIIRLWHTIILWVIVNTFFTLFSNEDPTVVWSLWGAFAIFVVLVAIAYLLKQPACEIEDKWYCPIL